MFCYVAKNRYSNHSYGCHNALMGVISAGFDPPLDIVFTLNTYTLRDLSVKIFFSGSYKISTICTYGCMQRI